MSRPYSREPDCSICEDAYFLPRVEPEPGSGPAEMVPCVCREKPVAAPAIDDTTVRTDLGYAS